MIKTVFMLESEESACARERIFPHVSTFERYGVDAYPMVAPPSERGKRKMTDDISHFDMVVIEGFAPRAGDMKRMRAKCRVIGCDWCGEGASGGGLLRDLRLQTLLNSVDFVTVWDAAGEKYLGGKHKRVYVVGAEGRISEEAISQWAAIIRRMHEEIKSSRGGPGKVETP